MGGRSFFHSSGQGEGKKMILTVLRQFEEQGQGCRRHRARRWRQRVPAGRQDIDQARRQRFR